MRDALVLDLEVVGARRAHQQPRRLVEDAGGRREAQVGLRSPVQGEPGREQGFARETIAVVAQPRPQIPCTELHHLLTVGRKVRLTGGIHRVDGRRGQGDVLPTGRARVGAAVHEAVEVLAQADRVVDIRLPEVQPDRTLTVAVAHGIVAAPADLGLLLGDREQALADRDADGGRTRRHEVGIGLALGAGLVVRADIDPVGPFAGLADKTPPGQADEIEVLFGLDQRDILEVGRGQHVGDTARVLLGREDAEELYGTPIIELRVGLQDDVREFRLTDVLLVDLVEHAAEVEVAGREEHRRVVADPARPLVTDLEAGDIDPKARTRRRGATGDIELQQRTGTTAIRGAPASRRELRTRDRVRREDREPAAPADVLRLAQGLVEVDHAIEGEPVDVDQVVPRPAAAHRKVGEVSCGHQPRHAVERAHGIAAGADGAAQLLTVEERGAGRAVEVGLAATRPGADDDLLERGRVRRRPREASHLEAQRRDLAAYDAHARFGGLHQTRPGSGDGIEPLRQGTDLQDALRCGHRRDGGALAGRHGHGHPLERPARLRAHDLDAYGAFGVLRKDRAGTEEPEARHDAQRPHPCDHRGRSPEGVAVCDDRRSMTGPAWIHTCGPRVMRRLEFVIPIGLQARPSMV